MLSFQIPVLGSTVGFLSPFPDSLPQLFLRCLPCAFAFGLFPFLPLSFVRFRSGSGYSASVSSFPLSSRFCLTVASSVLPVLLSLPWLFPVLSSLISHAFLPGSGTRLPVCFLSPFPASLPTAVPQVLPLCFRFRDFPLPFRFLSSPSVLPPATWPSVSSFPFSSRFRLTVASPVLRFRSRFFGLPRSSRPGFPGLHFPVLVLGFLFVSFHPSRFRSHSRSTGASLLFRFLSSASVPGFPLAFRILSSPSARF